MSFILKWLGFEKPSAAIGLRPHRDVELPVDYDAAYARVLSGIELVLGANVSLDDRRGGTVEATFGLVNSERIRCTLTRVDPTCTHVRVEAFFPAGAAVPARSRAVEALAETLARSG
ncbi:MAG: hypothetical protein JO029_11255 [Candidatus Eremiobacteraeota bacterium]|nr:hypothetical protein [Candidatus Eremiobacteraeota bacterium]